MGEADHHLMDDGRHPSVFAVLADDSDSFIAKDIRYIPLSSLRITARQQQQHGRPLIRGAIFDNQTTTQQLGLSSSNRLIDLAILLGNDYTYGFARHRIHPLIVQSETEHLPSGRSSYRNVIAQVAAFLNQNHDTRLEDIRTFDPIFREERSAQEFNRLIALCRKCYQRGTHHQHQHHNTTYVGYTDTTSPTQHNKTRKPRDDRGVLEAILDKGTSAPLLEIHETGHCMQRVVIEYTRCPASAGRIVQPLSCALYALLSKASMEQHLRNCLQYERDQVHLALVSLPPSLPPSIFTYTQHFHKILIEAHISKSSALMEGIGLLRELQQNGYTNKRRMNLLMEPIASLPCYAEMPGISGFTGSLRLAIIICRYLRGVTRVQGYFLPDCWINALLETACWLTVTLQLYREANASLAKDFPCSFPLLSFPSITKYLPDMDLVSIINW